MQRLTERERQILDLAAQHLTSKQIGPRLGIRPASVDTFMQTIIRKLGVAGRKDAIIAYLASRADFEGRDDLDFGLSPMVRGQVSGLARGVAGIDDPEDPQSLGRPSIEDDGGRTYFPNWAKARSGDVVLGGILVSPAWRLVAVAIAALALGLVTFGATAVGYGLNRTFDRALFDLFIHTPASRTKIRVPNHAQLDWSAYRQAAVLG